MKRSNLIKRMVLTATLLVTNVTAVRAADAAREDNSDLFVWIFLAFCALIIVAQLIPALMMMLGLAKGVKKETLQVSTVTADDQRIDEL